MSEDRRKFHRPDSPDRRKQPRAEQRHPVRYSRVDHGDGKEQLNGRTLNASDGGLCLLVEQMLDPGETLSMEIEADPRKRPVLAVGQVAWCRPDEAEGDGFLTGVELLWIDSGTWSAPSGVLPQSMWSFL